MQYKIHILIILIILSGCSKDKINNQPIFRLNTNERISHNHGITQSKKILQLKLSSSTETRFLVIENPHINKIYLKDKLSNKRIETGDHFPFFQRSYPHRFFIFPIKRSLDGSDIELTVDKSGENLSYDIHLLNRKSLEHYIKNDYLITGMIAGVYGLAIFLAIIMLTINRTFKYTFFTLYLIFSLVWILNDSGLLFEILWPGNTLWHKSSRGFFSSLTMILFALYLTKNDNIIFIKGVKKVTIILISMMVIKFVLAFFVAQGFYPDSLKYLSMHINAVLILIVFGAVFISLFWQLRRFWGERFEIMGILTYAAFVIVLSSKELGADLIYTSSIHQFTAILFFPFQCAFMSIHIFKKEKERKKQTEKEFIELKINQQRELDKKVLEVEENEKKRIAQNIHDEIGSVFVSIKYRIHSIREKWRNNIPKKEFDDLISLSEHGIKTQYSIIDDLLQELKLGRSLKESIQGHIDLILAREDMVASFECNNDVDRLNEFQKSQLFRIISELFTNTIKHAKASSVKLIIQGQNEIMIDYQDNGQGFDPQRKIEGRGLKNIRTRVNALKGRMELLSNDSGTRCKIEIPLDNE